jgi:hypothetical protein
MLDVVLVSPTERDELHGSIASWQEGDLRSPDLQRYRARRVELEWTGYEVHFDDESWTPDDALRSAAPCTIELESETGALAFWAPEALVRRTNLLK